ncbi:MAG: hypothetical protein J0M12_09210, partial [Deltaproteobacteria bacterium]|nr:hypothetical protein [Deltaproteobacteria bacterium]
MLWRPRAALADVVAVTLGTNISSMRAQRSLDRTGDALRTIFERLSSGARINRAADDAAGLAVSMSLSTRSRVLARSDRNVQDGISAINIADGALGQVSNTLARMAELAQQASNGSLGRFQRMSLHQEYRALGDEIRRISETTQFNGINLLAGTRSTDTGTILYQPDQAAQQGATAVSATGRYALVGSDDGFSTLGWNVYDRVTNTTTELIQTALNTPATMDASGNVVYSDGTNLFRYDISTRVTTKLTNSSVLTGYYGLQISADGSRLAFTSTTQFTDGASFSEAVSSTGSNRLYAVDLTSSAQTVRRVTQATFGLVSARQLSLSSDGSKIFFASNSNLAGTNADGNWEVYGTDLTAANLSIHQVTNTTGTTPSLGFQGASMKATNDGRVYFVDSRDYTGQNGAGNIQLFSASLSGSIAQIGNMNLTAAMTFSLSADESNISFLSARNLIGENPTLAFQAYRIDLGNGTLKQLTNFVTTANVTP